MRTDVASAEMIKLASNAFLATKICFINEIANVCEEVGADVSEVAAGMGPTPASADRFLSAGIGFGGSCFPKDVSALKQLAGNSGYHFQLLTAVIEVNELQKRRVVSKLKRHLGSLVGKEIALLGSPSSRTPTTCARPRASCWPPGCRARARSCAPTTRSPRIAPAGCFRGPDVRLGARRRRGRGCGGDRHRVAGVRRLDLDRAARADGEPVIVDGRNVLDAARPRAAGFVYEGIGRA